MTALIFEVPLPPQALSPNRRFADIVKRKMRREYKQDVYLCALGEMRRAEWAVPGRARVTLAFLTARGRVPDYRYRPDDCDNAVASFKAGLDALVSARLFADDNREVMELGPTTIDPARGPGVLVTVEALEAVA